MRRALRVVALCTLWAAILYVAGVLPTVSLWNLGFRGFTITLMLVPVFVVLASQLWILVVLSMKVVAHDPDR